MPFQLTHLGSGYFLAQSGKTNIDEINDINGKIIGHQEFDSHKFQLIHTLNADFSAVDPADGRITGATDSVASKMRANVKVAIIVTEQRAMEFTETYISSAKRLGSNWEFGVFADLNSSLEWLGISLNDIPEDFPRDD